MSIQRANFFSYFFFFFFFEHLCTYSRSNNFSCQKDIAKFIKVYLFILVNLQQTNLYILVQALCTEVDLVTTGEKVISNWHGTSIEV